MNHRGPSAGLACNPKGSRALAPKIGAMTQLATLQDRGFLSVMVFVPIGSFDSNVNGRRRCLDRRLACQSSQRPSASVKKIQSPPPAAVVEEFRARARPQPSFATRLVRPPLEVAEARVACIRQGGRTTGRDGRLRSACGRNSAAMAAVRGDSSLSFLQTAVRNVSGQASGWRIGDALSYSSQRRRTARNPQRIILFFIRSPSPSHSRTPPKFAQRADLDGLRQRCDLCVSLFVRGLLGNKSRETP
jgi:hypothetical protein